MARKKITAVAYLRTSSPTNASKGLASDKDSDKRQRVAIEGFAKSNGYEIVDEFYDVVSGADPIGDRPGFKAMLDRIAGNGVRTIIVESPDRFARDLIVQLTGHDYLKTLGVELVPASAPDFFLTDTPTAVLVRQVLGAISQFEKTSLVAKLKAARDRKRATGVKVEGRRCDAKGRFMARQPATLPSHAIFPKHRAVPPVSRPPRRHDCRALIFTVSITAIIWPTRSMERARR